VRAQRVSEQGKRGNDRADVLAKAGAAMHGLTAYHLAEVAAVRRLAREAARWGAEARLLAWSFAARMEQREERRAKVRGEGSGCLVVGKRPAVPGAAPGPGRVWGRRDEHESGDGSDGDRPFGHQVGLCKVQDAAGGAQGSLAFCWVCGAYFWKKVGLLSRRCTGRVIRGHVARIKKGVFPDGAHPGWRVGPVVPPTPPQLWQLRRQLLATSGSKGPAVPAERSAVVRGGQARREGGGEGASAASRASYLARLGIDEDTLRRWVARGSRRRAGPRRPASGSECDFAESGGDWA